MDAESKKVLDAILERDKDTLSQEELAFVMARRSYLSTEDKKRFSKEIDLHEDGKLFVAEKSVEEMNSKELKAKAKALGVEVKRGAKDDDIREAIAEALDAE